MPKTLLSFLIICLSFSAYSQHTTDTANHPYWIEMMQDPGVNFYQTQRAFNLYWAHRSIQKGDGYKVFKRWEWLAQQQIDSKGNFPDPQVQWQLQQMLIQQSNGKDIVEPNLGNGPASCLEEGNWKELGPVFLPTNNTSQINGMGRINAIALHPTDTNTFYVGAPAGGIWKTIDNGSNWTVYSDSLPTLGVSAIAINPNNPDTLYFGSGDRDAGNANGFGVFKSTNAGKSWSISNSGMGNRTVAKLIIDPTHTNTLIAATNNGIYRSTNAGSSWTRVQSGSYFKDLIFMPGNSDYVFATRNGLFYRSTNNGVNWTNITSGLPSSGVTRAVVDVNSKDSSLVYLWIANGSVHKGFYLSRDGGATFTTQSTTPNIHDYSTTGSGNSGQAWYNMDMVTDPTDAGIIYCGGVNIFKSQDTGKTWTIAGYWVNQTHADQHELVACPITKRIFVGNDGGLYYSRTQGTPWIPIKSGLAIAQIYKLGASRTEKDIVITGFQDNGTGNYRGNWATVRGGDGMDCEVDQTNPRYSYGELYYGKVFRVYNQTQQATIAEEGYTATGSDTINEKGAWVTPIALKEGSGNTMYIGYKNIWRSDNIRSSTVTWKKISNNLGGVNNNNFLEIESCIANPDILYASRSNGTFFRSDNVNASNPSWSALSKPTSGNIQAIETDPNSEQIVYISIANKVYKSYNKGTSWTQVSNNLAYNVGCILLDTSNSKKPLYIGTIGGGVWYTDSTRSLWRYFSNGIPATSNVTDLEMYYDNNSSCNESRLYASTYNRGIWFSTPFPDGNDKPVTQLEPYDTIVCKGGIVSFADNSCNNPSRFLWEFTPNTVSFINGTDSTSPNAVVQFAQEGVYNFKFMSENCKGIDTLTGQVIVGDTVVFACATTTTNNISGLGIFNVEMGSLSRSSSGKNPEGAYIDLSCSKVLKVKKGQTYTLNVTTGSVYTEQVKAFIDFNNNGTLNNSGEMVFAPSAAVKNHSDTFSIPQNAVTGKILRMRIKSDFSSVSNNPCASNNYGQTEDYGIYVEPDSITPVFAASDTVICTGNSVTYSDLSVGTGNNYSWNFGANASPATANTAGPHTVTYSAAGNKTIGLTIDGKTTTINAMVRVVATPDLSLSVTAGDTNMCEGANFSLSGNDANNTAATYQWHLDGSPISGANQLNYSKTNVAPNNSGNYTLVATHGNCIDSITQRIQVNLNPTANFSINDSSQCFNNNNVKFTNNSAISSGTLSYQWDFGDNNTSTATAPNHTYAAVSSFTVKLLTTSNLGCKDSLTKTVEINPSPVASFGVNDSTQCLNGNQYNFTNNSTITTGTLSYNWTFGDTNGSSTTAPTYNYKSSGNFIAKLVVQSNKGCRDSSVQNIVVFDEPKANFSTNDTVACFNGNHITFTNNSTITSGNFSSQWAFGDNSNSSNNNPTHSYNNSGTYPVKLVVISNNGCADSMSKNIVINPSPTVNFTINDSGQCLNSNLFTFTNNSSISAGSLSHTWNFGNGQNSSNTSPSQLYASAGQYTVLLVSTSNNGCADSLTKNITVHPEPQVSFSANNTQQCFNGNQFVFTNNTTIASGNNTYQWSFGDAQMSSTISPTHVYSNPGNYTVKLIATSNWGCKDSSDQSVAIFEMPKADFLVSEDTFCLLGNNPSFTNKSSIGTGSLSYQWRFGDGNSATNSNVNHTYISSNTYTVWLTATSNQLCKDSVSKQIHIAPMPVANFTANFLSQCLKHNQFVFTNTSTPSNNLSYTWDLDDGNTSTATDVNHSFTTAQMYSVQLISVTSIGCADTTAQSILVNPQPEVSYGTIHKEVCQGDTAIINAVNLNNAKLQWLTDGQANLEDSMATFKTDKAVVVSLVAETALGCKDTTESIQVVLKPLPSKPTINRNGFELSTGNYTHYQWYLDGSAINGADNQTHTAVVNGFYRVKVGNTDSCFNWSDSLSISNVNINPIDIQDGVRIYPNPTNGDFIIDITQKGAYEMFDLSGKFIQKSELTAGKNPIEIPELAAGVYIVKISYGADTRTFRVVKNNK